MPEVLAPSPSSPSVMERPAVDAADFQRLINDEVRAPSEAARTSSVRFPPDGDATLIDSVELSADCFAPIVLLTGSRAPDGNSPGNWFAVSGF